MGNAASFEEDEAGVFRGASTYDSSTIATKRGDKLQVYDARARTYEYQPEYGRPYLEDAEYSLSDYKSNLERKYDSTLLLIDEEESDASPWRSPVTDRDEESAITELDSAPATTQPQRQPQEKARDSKGYMEIIDADEEYSYSQGRQGSHDGSEKQKEQNDSRPAKTTAVRSGHQATTKQSETDVQPKIRNKERNYDSREDREDSSPVTEIRVGRNRKSAERDDGENRESSKSARARMHTQANRSHGHSPQIKHHSERMHSESPTRRPREQKDKSKPSKSTKLQEGRRPSPQRSVQSARYERYNELSPTDSQIRSRLDKVRSSPRHVCSAAMNQTHVKAQEARSRSLSPIKKKSPRKLRKDPSEGSWNEQRIQDRLDRVRGGHVSPQVSMTPSAAAKEESSEKCTGLNSFGWTVDKSQSENHEEANGSFVSIENHEETQSQQHYSNAAQMDDAHPAEIGDDQESLPKSIGFSEQGKEGTHWDRKEEHDDHQPVAAEPWLEDQNVNRFVDESSTISSKKETNKAERSPSPGASVIAKEGVWEISAQARYPEVNEVLKLGMKNLIDQRSVTGKDSDVSDGLSLNTHSILQKQGSKCGGSVCSGEALLGEYDPIVLSDLCTLTNEDTAGDNLVDDFASMVVHLTTNAATSPCNLTNTDVARLVDEENFYTLRDMKFPSSQPEGEPTDGRLPTKKSFQEKIVETPAPSGKKVAKVRSKDESTVRSKKSQHQARSNESVLSSPDLQSLFSYDKDFDLKFVEGYASLFEAFLLENMALMSQNPDLMSSLYVLKLTKIMGKSEKLEQSLKQLLPELRQEKQSSPLTYQRKLLEATRGKVRDDIKQQEALSLLKETTVTMEGKLKWQLLMWNTSRAKKEVELLQWLWSQPFNVKNPLDSLPSSREMKKILDTVAVPASDRELSSEQRRELRQLQMNNAFLSAEVTVLEKRLKGLKHAAHEHLWVDSVFRRMGNKEFRHFQNYFEAKATQ